MLKYVIIILLALFLASLHDLRFSRPTLPLSVSMLQNHLIYQNLLVSLPRVVFQIFLPSLQHYFLQLFVMLFTLLLLSFPNNSYALAFLPLFSSRSSFIFLVQNYQHSDFQICSQYLDFKLLLMQLTFQLQKYYLFCSSDQLFDL